MKLNYYLILLSLITSCSLYGQTVWTGPTTTFVKASNSAWTQAANQDRITPIVWLTRENNQGIFNIAIEGTGDACGTGIPGDTEWSYGTTANFSTLTYQSLGNLIGCNFSTIVDGRDMVVHLITDDIYIDIKFLSWQSGSAGGGFSYERSTDQSLNIDNYKLDKKIGLYPNPSTSFIHLTGLTEKQEFTLYNITGSLISTGRVDSNDNVNISNLKDGLYFLKMDTGEVVKFSKI